MGRKLWILLVIFLLIGCGKKTEVSFEADYELCERGGFGTFEDKRTVHILVDRDKFRISYPETEYMSSYEIIGDGKKVRVYHPSSKMSKQIEGLEEEASFEDKALSKFLSKDLCFWKLPEEAGNVVKKEKFLDRDLLVLGVGAKMSGGRGEYGQTYWVDKETFAVLKKRIAITAEGMGISTPLTESLVTCKFINFNPVIDPSKFEID